MVERFSVNRLKHLGVMEIERTPMEGVTVKERLPNESIGEYKKKF